jgi:hypothetical protein
MCSASCSLWSRALPRLLITLAVWLAQIIISVADSKRRYYKILNTLGQLYLIFSGTSKAIAHLQHQLQCQVIYGADQAKVELHQLLVMLLGAEQLRQDLHIISGSVVGLAPCSGDFRH